jgi:nucleoside-diphosphate-sugar epimerase
MTRIFITGANGCVGNALVRRLVALGHEVTALALNAADTDHINDVAGAVLVYGDVCDGERMAEILSSRQADVVIHLAAVVHNPKAEDLAYERVNYEATRDLFILANKKGVRQFIFVSTVAVYGESTEGPVDESSPCCPQTPYASSKLKAEMFIRDNRTADLAYTIIRPTTVYGKYDRGNIGALFRLVGMRVVPIIGDGANLKSLVYVENLADGIIKTILNRDAYSNNFILSDREPYSLNAILEAMERVTKKKIFLLRFSPAAVMHFLKILNKMTGGFFKKSLNPSSIRKLATNSTYDISKARTVLSYSPRYGLYEGLREAYGK